VNEKSEDDAVPSPPVRCPICTHSLIPGECVPDILGVMHCCIQCASISEEEVDAAIRSSIDMKPILDRSKSLTKVMKRSLDWLRHDAIVVLLVPVVIIDVVISRIRIRLGLEVDPDSIFRPAVGRPPYRPGPPSQ